MCYNKSHYFRVPQCHDIWKILSKSGQNGLFGHHTHDISIHSSLKFGPKIWESVVDSYYDVRILGSLVFQCGKDVIYEITSKWLMSSGFYIETHSSFVCLCPICFHLHTIFNKVNRLNSIVVLRSSRIFKGKHVGKNKYNWPFRVEFGHELWRFMITCELGTFQLL